MSNGASRARGDDPGQLRFEHFRRAFLGALLEPVHSRSGWLPDEAFRRGLLMEVLKWWLPVGVASGCFPRGVVEEWTAEALDSLPSIIDFESGSLRAPIGEEEWHQDILRFDELDLDATAAQETLYVAMSASTDEVANEFVARLHAGMLEQATEYLQERSQLVEERTALVTLAADLPMWMTDGPFRQRANIAFVGAEVDDEMYRAVKAWFRHLEIAEGDTNWHTNVAFEGLRDSLADLVRAERLFVSRAPAFDDWAPLEPESDPTVPADEPSPAFNHSVLVLLEGMLWRLVPSDEHASQLLAYNLALQPFVEAVLAESSPRASTGDSTWLTW